VLQRAQNLTSNLWPPLSWWTRPNFLAKIYSDKQIVIRIQCYLNLTILFSVGWNSRISTPIQFGKCLAKSLCQFLKMRTLVVYRASSSPPICGSLATLKIGLQPYSYCSGISYTCLDSQRKIGTAAYLWAVNI
jgi:hypothetical protein